MESEFNELTYDNLGTSDELNAPALGNDPSKDTSYAKSRRGTAIAVATSVLAITALGALGTGKIANAFLPAEPTFANAEYSLDEAGFHYSFDFDNSGGYEASFSVKKANDKVVSEALDISASAHYEGVLVLSEYKTDGGYKAVLHLSNGVDFQADSVMWSNYDILEE